MEIWRDARSEFIARRHAEGRATRFCLTACAISGAAARETAEPAAHVNRARGAAMHCMLHRHARVHAARASR
ncbi:hypothetical protein GCM10010985_31950 [Caballeronia grimmiae]|uniref:Uncharacterized protein n=1 Tax=Caballeronia grimmiae TaxID=1071679 RepID=A0ABQ1RPE4_9BURK|nr:hypothetical protein GCM10010985_31950 [Caballeronia grimmiae]